MDKKRCAGETGCASLNVLLHITGCTQHALVLFGCDPKLGMSMLWLGVQGPWHALEVDVASAKDVNEPEPAGDDLAFSESVLRSIFALQCNILDARVGAIMVVIQLMQGSEISSEAQCKQLGVLDEVVVRCRLYNTITRRLGDANSIIGLVITIPGWRENYRSLIHI